MALTAIVHPKRLISRRSLLFIACGARPPSNATWTIYETGNQIITLYIMGRIRFISLTNNQKFSISLFAYDRLNRNGKSFSCACLYFNPVGVFHGAAQDSL